MGTILITGLLMHWFADFVMQTHEQAMNKSTSMRALISHTGCYSILWLEFWIVYASIIGPFEEIWMTLLKGLAFSIITFIAHTTTDYFTSRWSKKFFSVQDYHNGFVVVGLDQILHYLQLYFTFYFLNI